MGDIKETTGQEVSKAPGARRYEVMVDGYDAPFEFTVVLSDFQEFQSEAATDPGMATNNFLLRTVKSPDRKQMIAYFNDHWGLPGLLMKELAVKMVDMRTTHLKNSNGT